MAGPSPPPPPELRPEHPAAQGRPPWHGNWYREWSVGRFAFEVEWVPRGRCYTFTFSINTPEKHLRRMEQEARPRVTHGVGHVVETRKRPPMVIEGDE